MDSDDFFEAEAQLLLRHCQSFIGRLREERQALARERAALEAEKALARRHNETLQEQVRLDIGGQLFHTTRSTLTRVPGTMLEAMFSGHFALDADAAGYHFLDRDPTYFGTILEYLREGRIPRVAGDGQRERLLREARFYGMTELCNVLSGKALARGLVVHWPFHEGIGDQARDGSRHAHQITLNHFSWCAGPGGRRAAIRVTSTDSSMPLLSLARDIPPPAGPYCIAAWVNPTAVQRHAVALGWRVDGVQKFLGLGVQPGACVHLWGYRDVDDELIAPWPDTGWRHVAMQYDGQQQQIWLDGRLAAEKRRRPPRTIPLLTGRVMGPQVGEAVYELCEVRAYDRTLCAEELAGLLDAGAPLEPGPSAPQ